MAVSTNRADIELPLEISEDIIQTIQEDSAVMKLANSTPIPGRGMEIPIILGDPEAYWVGETDKIKVSNPTFEHRTVKPYKMGVIVPFSNEFRRDYNTLFEAVKTRLPRVLSKKFDNTCFGNEDAPGSGFDTLKAATTQDFETDLTIPAEGDGMQSIAFNMAEIKDACVYELKDFQWYLKSDEEGKTTENLIDAEGTKNFFVKEGAGTNPYEFGTDPSGIINVKKDAVKADDAIYNLAGQRVSKDYKGIVVKAGKKTLNF